MSSKRLDRARRSQALDMQQSALLQLMLSMVVLFVLTLAAAYFLVIPRGARSPAAAATVLARFMRAGANNDSLGGHVLLSVNGLRTYSEADVAALFAQRTYFEGFEVLRVRSMRSVPSADGSAPDQAEVVAGVLYESSSPAVLTSRLELEEDGWHIATIELHREAQQPP